MPSQLPKPVLHVTTVHRPEAQPSREVLASAQAWPHAPQLEGSIASLAHAADDPEPQVESGEAQVALQ